VYRQLVTNLQRFGLVLLAGTLWLATGAHAAAPHVFHTPGYESPVRGDPDDLLMIAGAGFQPEDRVVYRAMDTARPAERVIPSENTPESGTAPIVQRDDPPSALTVRLPFEMQQGRAYRLWVVTSKNEWSEPVAINDPRPQWVTPSYVHSTADIPGLGRLLRIVGRNLAGGSRRPLEIRLMGRKEISYTLRAQELSADAQAVQTYVATAALPARISPGIYSISVRREGLDWIKIPDQQLEVRPDPPALPMFSPDDPTYGGCHPDDGQDDSSCFARAIDAAGKAGGGVVQVPAGHWDVTTATLGADGFVIPLNVDVRGAGPAKTFVSRHGPSGPRRPDALLTLSGHNSIVGLSFSDEFRFHALPQSRPVIQLGPMPVSDESHSGTSHLVADIVISNNMFLHVGRAITDDAGRPIARLVVTSNVFGAYSDAIGLPGSGAGAWEPFRVDDSVFRGNRFIPGSYIDLSTKQGMLGVIASGIGAAHHLDFSGNVADGTSTENLQDPDDPHGFRAAFFWNLGNNVELTLISDNQISCSGDKIGDGEAISLDGSGNTQGLNGTAEVTSAGSDWITVHGTLNPEQGYRKVPETYYNGHWVEILGGPGAGQTRKITSYTQDPAAASFTLHVAPAWDVVPGGASRIFVQRQYWQVVVVGNSVEQRSPACRKSNVTGPNGGVIAVYTPSADLVIEANRQWDTNGILFAQGYSVTTPSCPRCGNSTFFQTALDIRGNRVEGEYDWASDCSNSGIQGTFGASPTPESPPPVVGFGISISHNVIIHADAYRGGGIDIPLTSFPGPPPGNWPFIENLLIFHNQLRDIGGRPPEGKCHRGQRERSGIHLEGHENLRYSVLYGNRCQRVATPLADSGLHTLKICPSKSPESCECGRAP
jgi:hypothetical protein